MSLSLQNLITYILDNGLEPISFEDVDLLQAQYMSLKDEKSEITLEEFQKMRLLEIDDSFRTKYIAEEKVATIARINRYPSQVPRIVCVRIIEYLLVDCDSKSLTSLRRTCRDFKYVLDEKWFADIIRIRNNIVELQEILKLVELYGNQFVVNVRGFGYGITPDCMRLFLQKLNRNRPCGLSNLPISAQNIDLTIMSLFLIDSL